jgi:hypothetical protein
MLTVKTTIYPYCKAITITDGNRETQTTAPHDTDTAEALKSLSAEMRQRAKRAAEYAAFLDEAIATLEPTT